MDKINNRYSFFLFDGEGEGLGADADAFMDSISSGSNRKQSSTKSSLTDVQYGKGEVDTSHEGGDNEPSVEEQFAQMIGKGGAFHDVYAQRIQDTIQERFKNQADKQAEVDAYSEALSPLFMNYGLESGDLEGLRSALESDDAIYERGAERAGLDLEQYKQNLKLKAEAEQGRRITEAYQEQQRQNEMFAQWESEAEELKASMPNFDLASEIQSNETFAKLISQGISVSDAFASTHIKEILNGFNGEMQRQATQNVISNIQQRASRPVESAMSHTPAMQKKSDPKSLTNEDIDEIYRRVEAGETFSF